MSKSISINWHISKLKTILYDTRNNNCFLTCHKVCFLTVATTRKNLTLVILFQIRAILLSKLKISKITLYPVLWYRVYNCATGSRTMCRLTALNESLKVGVRYFGKHDSRIPEESFSRR